MNPLSAKILFPFIVAAFLLPLGARGETTFPLQNLRDLLNASIAKGEKKVVVPPGIYRGGPAPGSWVHITMKNVHNLEIDATGVTMICTQPTRAMEMDNCDHVTLIGLAIDYDPLPYTQGKVVIVSDDKSTVDVMLDAGYPQKLYNRLTFYDPKTRFQKQFLNHAWPGEHGNNSTWASPGVLRIKNKPGFLENVVPGDLATISALEEGNTQNGIDIIDSGAMTLRDVTLFTAPGFGIIEHSGAGGNRYFGCKIILGPKPAGATEDRLLTSIWDALNTGWARKGPDLENCVVENAGDDTWSVYGPMYTVVTNTDWTLMLTQSRNLKNKAPLAVGDRLGGFAAADEAVIQKLTPVDDKKFEVVLDRPIHCQPGDFLNSPDHQGRGFIYRNNTIRSPGRGALIKSSDGLIEGNTFHGSGKAIMICTEVPSDSHRSYGVHNLIIRNNTFLETGYHHSAELKNPRTGAITLAQALDASTLQPAGLFENIRIENNTFSKINGVNLVVSSASGIKILSNSFKDAEMVPHTNMGKEFGIDQSAVIWIGNARDIVLVGNRVFGLGPHGTTVLKLGANVENVTGEEDGVKLLKK